MDAAVTGTGPRLAPRRTIEPPAPTGLRAFVLCLPIWLYRVRLGWLLGNRFLLLTHRGRHSGLTRHVVLEVLRHDERTHTYFVVSGWGERAHWLRNVLARPEVVIDVGRGRMDAWATRLAPDEAAAELAAYARRHPNAARPIARFLRHRSALTEQDFAGIGRVTPVIALRAATPGARHESSTVRVVEAAGAPVSPARACSWLGRARKAMLSCVSRRRPGAVPAPRNSRARPGMTRRAVAVVMPLALTIEAGAACQSPPVPSALPTATVLHVIDGRTIQARLGRRIETVRYLGVVTPGPIQQRLAARRASALNRQLVEGRAVRLHSDEPNRDRDGRLLAYVYVGDVMVNAELVCRGYATVATDLPNEPHQKLFLKLEREARETGRGVWPRVVVRDGLVSVMFNATHAPDALRAIERATGIPIGVPDSLEGQTLTLDIQARRFEDVLRHVLAALRAGGMAIVYGPRGEVGRAILVDAAPEARGAPMGRAHRAQ